MTKAQARESSTDEVTRLRDCLDDLVSMMAAPAVWTGGQPTHAVSSALDALIGDTSELIAANERLTTELAERRRTEEVLRANELNFQLTVDSIPGMVHTMTATGGVEFVSRQNPGLPRQDARGVERLGGGRPSGRPRARHRSMDSLGRDG